MNTINEADLTNAAQAYAVANTPLFLIRRLQEDPVVHELAKSFSGEQIRQALLEVIARPPESLLDYAQPYVYLVALSKNASSDHLRAVGIEGTEKWRWFPYIREVLLQTYSPLSTATVLGEVARLSPSYSTLTRSDAPVTAPPAIVLGH